MKRKTITGSTYRGYPLCIKKGAERRFFKEPLDRAIEMVESATKAHSRVLSVRLDIHSENGSDKILSGRDVTRILENTKRNIASERAHSKNSPDIQYQVTTERTSECMPPHYHVNFLANKNAIRNGYYPSEKVKEQVRSKLCTDNDGLVHYCNSNEGVGLSIERNSADFEEQKANVIRNFSYLAKTEGKEFNPKGVRAFSCSRFEKMYHPAPALEDTIPESHDDAYASSANDYIATSPSPQAMPAPDDEFDYDLIEDQLRQECDPLYTDSRYDNTTRATDALKSHFWGMAEQDGLDPEAMYGLSFHKEYADMTEGEYNQLRDQLNGNSFGY